MLPRGVEVESEGGAVGVVVSVEVGHEDVVELRLREVGRAGVHHGAAVLLEHQLVQRHLPYPGKRSTEKEVTREYLGDMLWRHAYCIYDVDTEGSSKKLHNFAYKQKYFIS